MRQSICILFVAIFFISCKKSGNETVSESSQSYPKIHYSSTTHNVGEPVSVIFQNGKSSLFYK